MVYHVLPYNLFVIKWKFLYLNFVQGAGTLLFYLQTEYEIKLIILKQ
jgi:hypothetical protein